MCNTPNTDPFGNVIRDCYCEAQDIAASLKQENDRLKAEVEKLRDMSGDLAEKLIFIRQSGYFPADGHWALIQWQEYEDGMVE